MKIKIIFLVLIIINIICSKSYGIEGVVESQLEVLDMSSVIKEGKSYTNEVFPEIDIENYMLELAKGNINNESIITGIIKIFGKEIVNSVTLLGTILAIVVIHSILKNIGENLGNENVSKIAYYVEYILIITLITANFGQIVETIKESINNLTGFMNSLLPILLALISATGQVATITAIQPVLLFSIVIIGNIVNIVILPMVVISTVLDIVSSLSDKVQVTKLAKFFRSSAIWSVGFIITIFIRCIILRRYFNKQCRWNNNKRNKKYNRNSCSSSWESIRRFCRYCTWSYFANKKCGRCNRDYNNIRNMYNTNNKTYNT